MDSNVRVECEQDWMKWTFTESDSDKMNRGYMRRLFDKVESCVCHLIKM